MHKVEASNLGMVDSKACISNGGFSYLQYLNGLGDYFAFVMPMKFCWQRPSSTSWRLDVVGLLKRFNSLDCYRMEEFLFNLK